MLKTLQGFVGETILGFEIQGFLVFLPGGCGIVLIFLDASQPVVDDGAIRIVVTFRAPWPDIRAAILSQQPGLSFPSRKTPLDKISRAGRRAQRARLLPVPGAGLRLIVLHVVVADVVDQVDRFRVERKGFAKFNIGGRVVFFLAPAISRSVVPLHRLQRAEPLDFRSRFVFAAAGHARRAAIKFNQRLHRGEIAFVQLHRGFKFLARLFGQRQRAEPSGAIRFFAKQPAQQFVIRGVLRIERDCFFRVRNRAVKLLVFIVTARKKVLDGRVARSGNRGSIQDFDGPAIFAGGKCRRRFVWNFRFARSVAAPTAQGKTSTKILSVLLPSGCP